MSKDKTDKGLFEGLESFLLTNDLGSQEMMEKESQKLDKRSDIINYKILKYYNPWLRDKKLDNLNKKKYIIELPTQ